MLYRIYREAFDEQKKKRRSILHNHVPHRTKRNVHFFRILGHDQPWTKATEFTIKLKNKKLFADARSRALHWLLLVKFGLTAK